MEKYIKLLIINLFVACSCFSGFAQDEYDDEISYEPIHKTIYPADLNIDLNGAYDKNYSITESGDAIVFNAKKPIFYKKKVTVPLLPFNLPINPQQDFIVEYNFTCSNLSKSIIGVWMGNYRLGIKVNEYTIAAQKNDQSNIIAQSPKKWKLTQGENPDGLTIKFELRNKILTIYANNEYLGEISNYRTSIATMPVVITFFPLGKNMTLTFNSIKVDQGPVSDEAD